MQTHNFIQIYFNIATFTQMHYIFVFIKSKYKYTNINAHLEITDWNFRAMFSTYFKNNTPQDTHLMNCI